MNTRLIMAIFRKESLETIRDRRTLFIMLVIPIFLYPMLLITVGQVVTHQVSQLTESASRVAVLGDAPQNLSGYLAADVDGKEAIPIEFVADLQPPSMPGRLHFEAENDNPNTLRFIDPAISEWAFDHLRDGKVDAIVIFQEDAGAAFDGEGTAQIGVLFDATREASQQASDRVNTLLYRMQRAAFEKRLANRPDLPEGFNRPVRVAWENLAPPARKGNYLVGRILPTLLVMMIFLGAFYPAVDLTAGEKERGTLQTLLTSPARPMDLILGKFLTVFSVAMVAAMANLLSMAAAFTWLFKDMGMSADAAFQVDWGQLLMLSLQLIPVGCMVSAGMLAVCVFARSYKEAQHYMTPIYVLLLVPIILSALPGVTLVTTTAWMPVLNIMLLVRTSLMDPVGLDVSAVVFVANVVWAILAMVAAIRIFESEEVLLGGNNAVSDAFRIKVDHDSQMTPTLTLSLVTFCLGMVLMVYAGGGLQKMHLIGGMLATQWMLLATPSVLVARGLHLPLADTFSFRKPPLLGLLGAALIGLAGWAAIGGVVSHLQELFLQVPTSYAERMQALLGIEDDRYSISLMLLTFALTPAICEELFFRGLFFAGLRGKLSKWSAILVCGLAFGLFHLSIYRILPTAALGMVIAWVLWETRSIYTCMLLHFLNNATALCAAKNLLPNWLPNPAHAPELTALLPWIATCAIGIALIATSAKRHFRS